MSVWEPGSVDPDGGQSLQMSLGSPGGGGEQGVEETLSELGNGRGRKNHTVWSGTRLRQEGALSLKKEQNVVAQVSFCLV